MTTQNCGSCRHWLPVEKLGENDLDRHPVLHDDSGEVIRDDGDSWEGKPAPGPWGFCMRVDEFGPRVDSRFYVIDGSDYKAKLGCRSDFGCVEHEPAAVPMNARNFAGWHYAMNHRYFVTQSTVVCECGDSYVLSWKRDAPVSDLSRD